MPNEVWILSGRSPAETARTTAHESKHLKRHRQFGAKLENFESDANAYAAWAVQHLSWRGTLEKPDTAAS